nr:uncharacterized protein LOC109180037 [Ipomoea batatas]
MTIRRRIRFRLPIVFLLYSSILLIWMPELMTSAVVTLDSIEIFTTHELFGFKPTVYFRCKGENMTVLPDVKQKDYLYNFTGEESWQIEFAYALFWGWGAGRYRWRWAGINLVVHEDLKF